VLRSSRLEWLCDSDELLAECTEELDDLQRKLKPPEGREETIIMVLREVDFVKTLHLLERTTTTLLSLALVAGHGCVSSDKMTSVLILFSGTLSTAPS
jgi:hypothetical protein